MPNTTFRVEHGYSVFEIENVTENFRKRTDVHKFLRSILYEMSIMIRDDNFKKPPDFDKFLPEEFLADWLLFIDKTETEVQLNVFFPEPDENWVCKLPIEKNKRLNLTHIKFVSCSDSFGDLLI